MRPGDCPALDPGELRSCSLPDGEPQPEVVIVPDRHGTGTNGLLLTPPDAIAPELRARTAASATARWRAPPAWRCRMERVASLLLDIDTGADLDALRARLAGSAGQGAAHARGARPQPNAPSAHARSRRPA